MEKEIHSRSFKSGKDFTARLTLLKTLLSGTASNPDRKCRLNREEIRTGSATCAGYRADSCVCIPSNGTCLVPQKVKNLPVSAGDRVQSLGQEDPLEKRMAAHPSILAWRIPWTEEPSGL